MKTKMIDYLKIYTSDIDQIDLEYLQTLPEYSKNTKRDKTYYTGKSQNIKFVLNQRGFYLKGSPATLVYGSNIKTLKFHDLQLFINQIGELFQIDVTNFKISEIHLTDNLEMDSPPGVYKRYFGNCLYTEKIDYEFNGILYKNYVRELSIYDKLLEQQSKNLVIPQEYENSNLLRFEYKIKSDISRLLGYDLRNVSDLLKPVNWNRMIKIWKEEFEKIKLKNVDDIRDLNYYRSLPFDTYLLVAGIRANGGLQVTIDDINEQVILGNLSHKQKRSRIKKCISALESYEKELQPDVRRIDEILNKLEQKVEQNLLPL